MTKRFHDVRSRKKALLYGTANGIGPLTDLRHPRKAKTKKAPVSAANADEGGVEKVQPDSASHDTTD